MNEKTKKVLLGAGAIFVAVIFLTGFIINGGSVNSVPSGGKQPSRKNVSVAFASGAVNVIVTGYGSAVIINVVNQTDASYLNSMLSSMQNNGSVETYSVAGNSFRIYLSSINAYQFVSNLEGSLGSNSFSASSTEYLRLPKTGVLYFNGQPLQVQFSGSTYPLPTTSTAAPNSTIRAFVNALIAYQNGTYVVYNNNISVTT